MPCHIPSQRVTLTLSWTTQSTREILWGLGWSTWRRGKQRGPAPDPPPSCACIGTCEYTWVHLCCRQYMLPHFLLTCDVSCRCREATPHLHWKSNCPSLSLTFISNNIVSAVAVWLHARDSESERRRESWIFTENHNYITVVHAITTSIMGLYLSSVDDQEKGENSRHPAHGLPLFHDDLLHRLRLLRRYSPADTGGRERDRCYSNIRMNSSEHTQLAA